MKELLANEEDTVVVDQEIAKIEAGAAKPEGSEKPESKEPPKKDEASTEARPAPAEAENKPESKPAPEPAKPSPPPQPKKESQPKPSGKEAPAAGPVLGSREERRVCPGPDSSIGSIETNVLGIGQDEPHASSYRRAFKAVSKHSCFPDYLQRG